MTLPCGSIYGGAFTLTRYVVRQYVKRMLLRRAVQHYVKHFAVQYIGRCCSQSRTRIFIRHNSEVAPGILILVRSLELPETKVTNLHRQTSTPILGPRIWGAVSILAAYVEAGVKKRQAHTTLKTLTRSGPGHLLHALFYRGKRHLCLRKITIGYDIMLNRVRPTDSVKTSAFCSDAGT